MEDLREKIGSMILELRKKKNMSQDELAEKVGTTRSTISKWESGSSEPPASQLKYIADVFGVSVDYLCGGDNRNEVKICVLDTCVLLNRPRALEVIIKSKIYDQTLIPDVVVQELNYQKDHGKGSINQRAWLSMATIENNKNKIILERTDYDKKSINDDKILNVAKKYAVDSISNKVDIITNDVYFSLKHETSGLKNLRVLSLNSLDSSLYDDENFDEFDTQKFISAVKSKKLEEVKKAYKPFVNINRVDSQTGRTPLIIAIKDRSYEIIKYLLSLDGLDIERRDEEKYAFTPLLYCCQLRDLKSMNLLINNGASVNASSRGKNVGNTPLMVCAWGSFNEGLKLLMENKDLSYNQQDNNGFTALHKACIKDNYEGVKILIDCVDNNIEDFNNKKAFEHLKKNSQHYEEIRELFSNKYEK